MWSGLTVQPNFRQFAACALRTQGLGHICLCVGDGALQFLHFVCVKSNQQTHNQLSTQRLALESDEPEVPAPHLPLLCGAEGRSGSGGLNQPPSRAGAETLEPQCSVAASQYQLKDCSVTFLDDTIVCFKGILAEVSNKNKNNNKNNQQRQQQQQHQQPEHHHHDHDHHHHQRQHQQQQ